MSAVLVPAGTEQEWLAARREGITASEIAVIMGLAPPSHDSPFALYHRKRGDLPEIEDSDALERGRVLEPYIAAKFAERHPELAVAGDGRQLYAHPLREWQLATPDRLAYDWRRDPGLVHPVSHGNPLAVVECKTDAGEDGEVWGEDGSDDIPVHYRCQVLWQMDVFDVALGYVVCLAMRSWRIRVYQLHLDEQAREDLVLMRREARAFRSRLDLGVPPDVDWRPPTTAALKRLHPDLEDTEVPVTAQLARWYLAACRHVDDAKKRKALYENRIREQIGAGHRVVDRRTGQVIAVRQVYPVRAHTRKASTVDKLVPKQPKGTAA